MTRLRFSKSFMPTPSRLLSGSRASRPLGKLLAGHPRSRNAIRQVVPTCILSPAGEACNRPSFVARADQLLKLGSRIWRGTGILPVFFGHGQELFRLKAGLRTTCCCTRVWVRKSANVVDWFDRPVHGPSPPKAVAGPAFTPGCAMATQ